MDYLLLEMPNVLFLKNNIEVAGMEEEIDKINETISLMEAEMLEWCSVENFLEAKEYYTERMQSGNLTDLFEVETLDLIGYVDELISKKKERGR